MRIEQTEKRSSGVSKQKQKRGKINVVRDKKENITKWKEPLTNTRKVWDRNEGISERCRRRGEQSGKQTEQKEPRGAEREKEQSIVVSC